MNSTKSSIEIGAESARVTAVIADLERYPEWVDALKTVEVLTTRDDKPETVRMILQTRFFSDDYTVACHRQPDKVSGRPPRGLRRQVLSAGVDR